MSEWHRFPSVEELDRALAEHIAGRLRDDLHRRGAASLAVSGGSTPRGMFRQLSRCELDWPGVWLTLVDERRVDSDHADSNERMVRAELLQNRAAAASFVGLALRTADDLAVLAERMALIPRPFSLVVLGMGSDGHTASWFPRAENLPELLDPTAGTRLAVTEPVTAPHQRITLTLPAVLDSREIIVHITGREKKIVMEQAAARDYPVAAVITQQTTPTSIWWAP